MRREASKVSVNTRRGMAGTPEARMPARYRHGCAGCEYLGRHGACDLYRHEDGSLIVRRGSRPDNYRSSRHAVPRDDRPMRTAYKRAKAAGLDVSGLRFVTPSRIRPSLPPLWRAAGGPS